MLTRSNIILLSMIGFLVIFLAFFNNPSNEKTISNEKFDGIRAQPIYRYKYKSSKPISSETELVDDVVSWSSSLSSANITKEVLNKNFLNIQFHNDYRDVITAINNLVPEKRQRFNLANIPIQYSEPETDEVKLMVNDFITVLNENIKSAVPIHRNVNSGWDEAITDPTVESGWNRVQKSLGLAPSIYEDPALKNPVKLIAINYVQKYETDDEIKYAIDLVLQKYNVDDQMSIKATFVQDKRPLNDENNFFVTKNIDMKVIIEDVFLLGFLSNDGPDSNQQFDLDKEKFYDYNILEYNNMTDPKYIQRVLMDKYKMRTFEMEQRNALLDEEGQAFHRSLPNIYDFSNIRDTRTIYDDMNTKKVFY
ncbi:hypothetical protein QKU48_gp0527 [Fadolivirus algeromassiliense]|jgi:hypothetical protein|uniref:Uncharacterized protein n=1 Tax=Fadolivirus FV1/VV64 TaxID=3070911 RepID=A0A7D3QUA0_9VIRU|nr:hypothetical protein QKU48_gp0527 [Fadolivirus algeromassiliense]QKF93985.1 hypothetical protein Fadolivirus_1_527 [Fadolivirus FV1/VV64]